MNYKKYMVILLVLLGAIANTYTFSASMQITGDDLCYAIRCFDQEKLKQYLEQDANPNAPDDYGHPALHVVLLQTRCSKQCRANIIRLLLDYKANVDALDPQTGSTPLARAVENRDEETVQILLEAGANPNAKRDSYHQGTVLHNAVENNDRVIATLLLRHSANPNLLDRYGATPLEEAIDKDNTDMVHLLLNRGANPNLVSPRAYTTPLYAITRRSFNGSRMTTLRLLLEKGANPNQVAPKGKYLPLDEALAYSEEWYLLVNARAHRLGGSSPVLCWCL